ncbi:hypothetical protein PO909_014184 [Leuciscus waleckii]
MKKCSYKSSTISNRLRQKWSQQATESNTSSSDDQSAKSQEYKKCHKLFLGLLGQKQNILQNIFFRLPQKQQRQAGLE